MLPKKHKSVGFVTSQNKTALFYLDKPNTRRRNLKRIQLLGVVVLLVLAVTLLAFRLGFVRLISEKFQGFRFSSVITNTPKTEKPNYTIESDEEKIATALEGIVSVVSISKSDEHTVSVNTTDEVLILIDPTKDINTSVNSLQTILTQARIEKRLLRKIDLRFNKIAIESN